MITLSDIFSQYDVPIDPALSDAPVSNIRINRERRIITLTVHPASIVRRSAVFALQKAIVDGNVGADRAIVHVRYAPEMFRLDYFSEIIALIAS